MGKKKCFHCNSKLKLISYTCNCKNNFCAKCRLPESHNCTFNYKSEGKENLQKKLIKVEADKITKI